MKTVKCIITLLVISLTSISCLKDNAPTSHYISHSMSNSGFHEERILKYQSSHRKDLNAMNNIKSKGSKIAYVCVTGQFSRLELQNKIEHLFYPLHKLGYSIYVGLALAEGPPKYTNTDSGARLSLQKSIGDAISQLRDVNGVESVRYLPPKLDNLQYNEHYRKQLGLFVRGKKNNTIYLRYRKNHSDDAINHARQYKTLQHCNDWTKMQRQADLLVRVREDVLIYKLDLQYILQLVDDGALVTSKCDQWRGINDKIAFAPGAHASKFFNSPYSEYVNFTVRHSTQYVGLNPEQLYKVAYAKRGFVLLSTKSLVVTKTVMSLKNVTELGNAKNCTVTANPFKIGISINCPLNALDELAYDAFCWK